MLAPDRFWLITWTTFGSWLPGDRRGSRSPIRLGPGRRVRMNVYGTPSAPPQPRLQDAVRNRMTAPPVRLSRSQARVLLASILRTAEASGWTLYACAVMSNHVHVVVGVPGDPDPALILRDLKRLASRALNERWGDGGARRWWTRSGSRRLLVGEPHVIAAVRYVRDQYRPLALHVRRASSG